MAMYAPDCLIWHNDDLLEQSVEDNLKVLAGAPRRFGLALRRRPARGH